MQNNNLTIIGTLNNITAYREFDTPKHTLYKGTVSTTRLSGKVDEIPCLIDDIRVPVEALDLTATYIVDGELRTRLEVSDDKRHNRVYVHITAVTPYLRGLVPDTLNVTTNKVCITGRLCSTPDYCEKSNGRRVSTVIVRVEGRQDRHYYIPCVLWGENAVSISKLHKYDQVTIRGRIQQRDYVKADGDKFQHGIAYELSVQEYKVVCE